MHVNQTLYGQSNDSKCYGMFSAVSIAHVSTININMVEKYDLLFKSQFAILLFENRVIDKNIFLVEQCGLQHQIKIFIAFLHKKEV